MVTFEIQGPLKYYLQFSVWTWSLTGPKQLNWSSEVRSKVWEIDRTGPMVQFQVQEIYLPNLTKLDHGITSCGMVRFTNTQTSQHTPWGSTLPKKRKEKMKGRTRKKWNDHPLELNIPKCDPPKHPKIPKKKLPSSKSRSKNLLDPDLAPTKFCTPTTLPVTPLDLRSVQLDEINN